MGGGGHKLNKLTQGMLFSQTLKVKRICLVVTLDWQSSSNLVELQMGSFCVSFILTFPESREPYEEDIRSKLIKLQLSKVKR